MVRGAVPYKPHRYYWPIYVSDRPGPRWPATFGRLRRGSGIRAKRDHGELSRHEGVGCAFHVRVARRCI